jgi:competence protein ComEA
MLKKILAVLLMLYAAVAMAAVDVNKANEKELDAVKGIGPVTSKAIMAERKKGEFKNWQDFIDRVKGVGDARAAKLSSDGLTVNGESYKATTTKKEAMKEARKDAKEDKKESKAAAKEEKKDVKAAAKEEKAMAKADAAKPVASAKAAASAKK